MSLAGSPSPPTAAALRAAAAAGDLAACQRLLGNAKGVRFSRDEAGRSALHLAASNGHVNVVRLLLGIAAPKEADGPDGDGCTALQRAAADGHEEVVRILIARGVDIDRSDTLHGNTAIHEASWKGYSRIVRLLAAGGANLSKANAGGFTPLHLCCQNGHNQSCRELLLAGCDPDLQNNYGDTALHTAARYGHAGVTRILISAQCKVSEQNKNGDTALHISAAMGRRKLTRILLEAGCDKSARNKQSETARDIASRKHLDEILDILDDCVALKRDKKNKSKKRSKSKVRFAGKQPGKDVPDTSTTTPLGVGEKPKGFSPYGCHYYPDPEVFPSPRLDSLPKEPLKKGEQYYLDLAGNICKGPIGVGYTCYCAPLFRHLEARIERDKRELLRAQARLGQRVAGLEQKLNRGAHGRRSERVLSMTKEPEPISLPRSRSLEMLDKVEKSTLQATRSMDELEAQDTNSEQRPSVKELVARIQRQQHDGQGCNSVSQNDTGNHSESSDDEDGPLRMTQRKGIMGDSNMVQVNLNMSNYENVPGDAPPRSRSGVYSPTVNSADLKPRYIEPIVQIKEGGIRYNDPFASYNQPSTSKYNPQQFQPELRYADAAYSAHYYDNELPSPTKYYDNTMSARLAKLRVLDTKSPPSRMLDVNYIASEHPNHDSGDRDTNNDSGYSTKVYGSSKGNSPSLSGQIEGDGITSSSLV